MFFWFLHFVFTAASGTEEEREGLLYTSRAWKTQHIGMHLGMHQICHITGKEVFQDGLSLPDFVLVVAVKSSQVFVCPLHR